MSDRVIENMSLRNYIGIMVFLAALIVGIRQIFYQTFSELISLMQVEEYGYIFTALIVTIILLAINILNVEILSFIRLSNIIMSIIFVLTSMIFYILSRILLTYALTLSTISMILFVWGLFILFFPKESLKKLLLPLLSFTLLIPLPREIIDRVSVTLTRVVGNLAAILSGAHIAIKAGGRVYLEATGAAGKVSFEIIAACSGIISMGAFLALVPLFIYLTRWAPIGKRLKMVLLSTTIGLAIVFFGNVLRVTIMIILAKELGTEIAYEFFHSAPSIIYSVVATIVSIYLLARFSRRYRDKNTNTKYNHGRLYMSKTKSNPTIGRGGYTNIILLIVFLALIIVVTSYIQHLSMLPQVKTTSFSYDYVIENTLHIILNNKTKIIYERNLPALERVLGSSLVKAVSIEFNGTRLSGYVEFAETPARFHGWWVCLTYQGYVVRKTWSEEVGGNTLTFVEYSSRYNKTFILAYMIFEVPIYFESGNIDIGYIRLSLISRMIKNIPYTVTFLKNYFANIINNKISTGVSNRQSLLYMLSNIDLALIIIAMVYYGLAFIMHLITKTITTIKIKSKARKL